MVSYIAFSVPAVIGGFASDRFGLDTTAQVYGAVILIVTIVAFVLARPKHPRQDSNLRHPA